MRKIDKKLNLNKANLLTEQRYLESKGISEDFEIKDSPELNDLIIVRTPTEFILVNKNDNTIEAELGPIGSYSSKEALCNSALRIHMDIFEGRGNVYHGGGDILGPLSACKKGGLEENKPTSKPQDTYFETLSQTLDAVRAKAKELGYELDEEDVWTQFGTGGISYEETKQANIRLLKNGEPILDKRGKELNRFIRVAIYRMGSGTYELTMYKTW